MNFLFVSRWGMTHDLASCVQREGHAVKYHVISGADRDVGDGIVPKVERWEDEKDWAEVIVFDEAQFGETCERLRADGKRVVGGTRYSDRLESDRDFAQAE